MIIFQERKKSAKPKKPKANTGEKKQGATGKCPRHDRSTNFEKYPLPKCFY